MKSFSIFLLFTLTLNILIFAQEDSNDINETLLFEKYMRFLSKYNKTYSSLQEVNERFSNFLLNYKSLLDARKEIEQDNQDIEEIEEDRIKLGVTDLFDLSDEEYEKQYLDFSIPEDEISKSEIPSEETFINSNENESDNLRNLQTIPTSFDWRNKGVVGVVKNQGICGCCYAFSAVGNIESLYAIKHGELLNFSEQQILNCDPSHKGCNGGIIGRVFDYLKNSNGLGLTSSLKYISRKQTCSIIKGVAKVLGKKYVGSNNEDSIARFLFKNGPLSAAVNAKYFRFYRGGIMKYSKTLCGNSLNHAVLIVGYGVSSNGTKFWIVKNSYGKNWGENGYVRIARGTCSINRYVLSGIIA